MDPDYLPRLIELMRANNFTEAEIVDVTSRLVGPHPADLVIQREVIATAVFTALIANKGSAHPADAIEAADALIAELSK
jgi:hypothetical protein